VSLQARTRSSFQAELDLRTAADELMEKRRKKCYICSLKRPPEERRLAIVFFFFTGFPENACSYILIIVMYVDVCTLPLLVASCAYWLMTRCVVSTIIRSIIFIQAKLLDVTTILLSMGNSYYTSALAHYSGAGG
jgi:hypothetical protein